MPTQEQNDWVARVLQVGPDATHDDDEPLDPAAMGLDTADLWQGAVESYDMAVETVDQQISALQAALRETDDADLHEIAEFGLNGLTGNTRVPLMAAIREAGSGSEAQLKTVAPKLSKAVAAFRNQIRSEARVAACDDNPFGVPVTILESYEGALDEMEKVLRRVA